MHAAACCLCQLIHEMAELFPRHDPSLRFSLADSVDSKPPHHGVTGLVYFEIEVALAPHALNGGAQHGLTSGEAGAGQRHFDRNERLSQKPIEALGERASRFGYGPLCGAADPNFLHDNCQAADIL